MLALELSDSHYYGCGFYIAKQSLLQYRFANLTKRVIANLLTGLESCQSASDSIRVD